MSTHTAINLLSVVLVAVLLIPVAVLCAEFLAAAVPGRRRHRAHAHRRPRMAVLIPAHNEEAGLGLMLKSLMPQMRATDRVVVVADNCSDGTFAVALSYGAIALARHDTTRPGKGHALAFGLHYLEPDPPEVVIMIDADCRVHDQAVDRVAAQAAVTGRPVQARYLLQPPKSGGTCALVSTFAFLVKNWVRPCGLDRLHLPCLLTGAGMAFPWSVIQSVRLDTGNIVEDLQLGLDLAVAGHAPLFCGHAHITSSLPERPRAAHAQRTRWEHGHLHTLLTQGPRLFRAAVAQRRPGLLALALELTVPPLSLLVILLALGIAVTGAAAYENAWPAPALTLAGAAAALAACIGLCWLKFGRHTLPLVSILAAPGYILWKIPIYLTFLLCRQRAWVRTDRGRPAMSTGLSSQRAPASSTSAA